MNRVLLVANTGWYLYNFRLPLARRLRDQGLEVVLVSPHDAYVARLEAAGFSWRPLRLNRTSLHPLRELGVLRQLIALYRREQPVLVHHFTVKCVLYGTAAARLCGVPAVVNAVTGLGHGFTTPGLRGWGLRGLLLGLYRLVLCPPGPGENRSPHVVTIFQNPDDRAILVKGGVLKPEHTALIPGSGVDTHRFDPARFALPSQSPPQVLFVGRLTYDKGLGDLIEALGLLHQRGVPFTCRACGAADPAGPSGIPQEHLDTWEWEGLIELVGHLDPIEATLAEADLVVLPSHGGEGVPRSLVEAASMSKAIVSTDVPGCRDIVQHEHNGLLVPRRAPEALARAMERLLVDPDLRLRMGLAGRQRVLEQFSEAEVLRQTQGVYQALGALPSAPEHADPLSHKVQSQQPARPHRVLFVLRSLATGGAERQLTELVKAMDTSRFQITVATYYPGGALADELRDLPGVQLVDLRKTGRWDLCGFAWRLWKVARRCRPEVVHGYLGGANLISLLLGKAVGARVAWGIRGSRQPSRHHDAFAHLIAWFEARLSGCTDLIVINSQRGRDDAAAAGYRQQNLQVISNGIDTDRFHPKAQAGLVVRARWGWDAHHWVIGLVGRLDPVKDHPTFLRAAQQFAAHHPQARFVCIGAGNPAYGAGLRPLAAPLGDRLRWVESEPDMAAAYNALDLLSLTSTPGEGFPNVLGEAMACGIPVVTTDSGDARRVVGRDARVVACGNVQGLLERWEEVYALAPAERLEEGLQGRERILGLFTTRRLVEATQAALGSLLLEGHFPRD